MKNLHPEIVRRIEEQQKQGGIELGKVEVGTHIEAQTRNSLYKITVLENGKFTVQGGHYFPEPDEAFISGSTWGGSMLKMKWLGVGMHIELGNERTGRVTTTAVKSLKVLAPDRSWEYDLV